MTGISCATVLFVALPGRETETGVVGIWRLLASNHRELARSATVYGSFESAYSTVIHWQSRREEFEITTFHGPNSGMHGWSVSIDGSVAFTSSRWYETGSMSLESCAASIAAFCGARVSDSPWGAAAMRRSIAARAATPVW